MMPLCGDVYFVSDVYGASLKMCPFAGIFYFLQKTALPESRETRNAELLCLIYYADSAERVRNKQILASFIRTTACPDFRT